MDANGRGIKGGARDVNRIILGILNVVRNFVQYYEKTEWKERIREDGKQNLHNGIFILSSIVEGSFNGVNLKLLSHLLQSIYRLICQFSHS